MSPSSSTCSPGASSVERQQLDGDSFLDALEQALNARQSERNELVHQSDRGLQYGSIKYSERLAESGIELSVRSKATVTTTPWTINGLYKAELIPHCAFWKIPEAAALATLKWVSWFNRHRLLKPLGYTPAPEAEANYYQQLSSQAIPALLTLTGLPESWGSSVS